MGIDLSDYTICTCNRLADYLSRLASLGNPHEVWAPTLSRTRLPSGRIEFKPAITGYLYCPTANVEPLRRATLHHYNVRPMYYPSGTLKTVPLSDLQRMDDALKLERELTAGRPISSIPDEYFYRVGEKVRVLYGPLAGTEGTVLQVRRSQVLMQAAEVFGGTIKIARAFLEKF